MSKQCPSCRATLDETRTVCPFCGAEQPADAEQPAKTMWETNFWSNPAPMSGVRGKTEYPSSTAKGLSIALAVFCFLAAFSMLGLLLLLAALGQMADAMGLFGAYIVGLTEYFLPVLLVVIADAAFYVVFGILLLVKKHWKIALTITIYCSVWYVLGLFAHSTLSLPTMPIIGILCTVWLRKAPDERNTENR